MALDKKDRFTTELEEEEFAFFFGGGNVREGLSLCKISLAKTTVPH